MSLAGGIEFVDEQFLELHSEASLEMAKLRRLLT